jgi:hypothetical protein
VGTSSAPLPLTLIMISHLAPNCNTKFQKSCTNRSACFVALCTKRNCVCVLYTDSGIRSVKNLCKILLDKMAGAMV